MALVGLVLAVDLQRSTAVELLAAGFMSSGILTVLPCITALLGADLGLALSVNNLSLDLSGVSPFLLLVGSTIFLKFETSALSKRGGLF